MTHTSTEQPEALRLAEFFESMQKSSHRWYDGTPVHEKAAAELRRLHAENEVLRKQLQSAQAVQQAVQPTLISKLESIALKFASAYEAAGRETYREDAEKQARKAKQHLTAALQSALATHPTQQGLDAQDASVLQYLLSNAKYHEWDGGYRADFDISINADVNGVRAESAKEAVQNILAAQAKQGGADHG